VKQRPLQKTVTPLADELLSGWLTRLAVTNHCQTDELLAHMGGATRQVAMLDFEVEAAATTAEKISIAARVAAETVQSLAFGAMTKTEALMTAQVAFQSCPDCSRRGIALKQWRKLRAFDCHICGTRLLSIFIKPDGNQISEKLVRRARRGTGLLESAVRSNCANRLRRAMRAVTYAQALKSGRADAAFALQSPRPDVRLFCLAAIALAQSRPRSKRQCSATASMVTQELLCFVLLKWSPVFLPQLNGLYCETGKTQPCWHLNITFKGNKRHSTRRGPYLKATRHRQSRTSAEPVRLPRPP
jgi:hypothetical protein